MRGYDNQQSGMFSYISPEQRVPEDHPLRAILRMTDAALGELTQMASLYSPMGRPSIAPEKLMRALLLQVLYSVRSERMLMEQLNYNLLFRWFVGLSMDDAVWDASVFSKNRERLLEGDVAQAFFDAVLRQARDQGFLSDEHFTVDGTLLEAWASRRSFQKKPDPPSQGSGSRKEVLLRDTHVCKTDPDATLYRKSRGAEMKLCHMAHVLMENSNGLPVATRTTEAITHAEWMAATEMLTAVAKPHKRITVGADGGYDWARFVEGVRKINVTPHVAQHTRRSSAIDGRTTRHSGYQESLRSRKRIESIFGWLKTTGMLRKVRHRGRARVQWAFTFALAAYSLVRLRTLTATA